MRVIVVDDDAIVCRSIATILSAESDVDVLSYCANGEDAIARYDIERPDVLLMDIRMPGMGGLLAAEAILASDPYARIVFLTTFSDEEYVVRALRMGARGYLIKQDVASIAPALRTVMAGQCVLEGEILERAAQFGGFGGTPLPKAEGTAFSGLTVREREVVRCVADGLSNAEIAEELFMSAGTVRNHISVILDKLCLKNRTQIAVHYYRHCL